MKYPKFIITLVTAISLFFVAACSNPVSLERDVEEVNAIVMQMSSPAWSVDTLSAFSLSSLDIKSNPDAQLLLKAYQEALGPITEIAEPVVTAEKSYVMFEEQKLPVFNYMANVTFEKSKGELRLALVKENNLWKISNFSVESQELIDYMESHHPELE